MPTPPHSQGQPPGQGLRFWGSPSLRRHFASGSLRWSLHWIVRWESVCEKGRAWPSGAPTQGLGGPPGWALDKCKATPSGLPTARSSEQQSAPRYSNFCNGEQYQDWLWQPTPLIYSWGGRILEARKWREAWGRAKAVRH